MTSSGHVVGCGCNLRLSPRGDDVEGHARRPGHANGASDARLGRQGELMAAEAGDGRCRPTGTIIV